MKLRFIALAVSAAGFVFAQSPAPGPLHLFVSSGIRPVVEQLQPQIEKAAGRPLMMEFGTTASLRQKIESGQAFDAAVLTTEVMDDLAKKGKISAAGLTGVARAGIGMGVRSGQPKPDIHTPDAIKNTLLHAKSVTYAQEGASRTYLEMMYDKLGIADQIKPKVILTGGSAISGEKVAKGESDIILTLISEILPVQGVQLVGPLPSEFQHYVAFTAGLNPNSKNADSAKALLKTLGGPGVAPVLKSKGMEPLPK